ncbi:MAG TPA: TlpA disulfide reductase family protein [Steroidobacteraceae bacterium]|nr:TlpA disulfide reductase family protein [Steroidobacteraceae bacterium]
MSAAVAGAQPYALLGASAPDFTLKATSGTNFRLAEYRGQVVALAFWGSRCGQCGAQLAAVSRLVDTYRTAGFAALAVDVDDDLAAAARFAVAHPVSFPVLLDPAKDVARAYRIDNLPMLLLVDRGGTIRWMARDYGSDSGNGYLQQVRTLLDE